MIAPDAARAIGASVTSAEVTFLPCGHFPQLEVPDLLSEALVTFAARCAAGQGVRS
jgi:pimeloyl-ACP methyl ester carboxylesterase